LLHLDKLFAAAVDVDVEMQRQGHDGMVVEVVVFS